MKSLFLVASLALSSAAHASYTITCEVAPYRVIVAEATVADQVIPVLVLEKEGRTVTTRNLNLEFAGYEPTLLKAYIWGFKSTDNQSGLGVGVEGLQTPKAGTYKGRGELFLNMDGHQVEASSTDCTVVLK